MKTKTFLGIHDFTKRYIDWVIRLGRVKFSLLGVVLLALFALVVQILLSLIFIGQVHLPDILRSICFGLCSAPFVVYFFTLLVERLERSRLRLAALVDNLRHEISDRITAQKRLSEALSTLAQNHREKSALMATISHELRTPLNGIIGLSSILLDDQLTESQRNYLQTINMSAVALGHIFSDIIDLEKIDANRIELHYKETDVPRFIHDIANFATLMTQQRKLSFTLNYPTKFPHWLMLDSARLSQVLWNLINNAVKFTPEGGITLDFEIRGKNEYAFIIKDTGIGIPKNDLAHIFDMYYQVQSSGYKPAGSGIGLAVSKTIANLMGGDLSAQSELGKGSTFTVTFQAEKAEKPLKGIEKLPATLRILLVEDIEVNIIVAKAVLEKLGYCVDVAMTGRDAITMFEQNDYDLLLLDIQLPDISGFEVAQHLRENYENGVYDYLPPMIALTANVMQSKAEYRRKGMDDVLRKPLEVEDLLACLLYYFDDEFNASMACEKYPCLQGKEEKDEDKEKFAHLTTRFDIARLQELIEILGRPFVEKNLQLFFETMPEYLAELDSAYQAYQQDPSAMSQVGNVAHKIKGAAASVGLKRLQELMQQGQNIENSEWPSQIANWIKELHSCWQEEVRELQAWLRTL